MWRIANLPVLSVSKCESSTVFCEAGYKKLVRNFTSGNLSTVDFINHCMFVYFTFIFHVCRAYGNAKHCRKLFQRVLNSVSDWPESISEAYMQFEREEGKYFIDSLFYGLFYCTLSVNCVSKNIIPAVGLPKIIILFSRMSELYQNGVPLF